MEDTQSQSHNVAQDETDSDRGGREERDIHPLHEFNSLAFKIHKLHIFIRHSFLGVAESLLLFFTVYACNSWNKELKFKRQGSVKIFHFSDIEKSSLQL